MKLPTTNRTWSSYRQRRNAFIAAIASVGPAIYVATLLLGRWIDPDRASYVGAGIALVVVGVSSYLYMNFKCPRCGRVFQKRMVYLPGTRECVHCGQVLFGAVEPQAADATLLEDERSSNSLIAE